jgi:mono/diheme cytochrome c family protein
MKSETIKLELIAWLTQLDNKTILSSLLNLKKFSEKENWSDQLAEDQLKSLHKAIEELENNLTISSQDFWKNYGR